jgi:hypothetical protein
MIHPEDFERTVLSTVMSRDTIDNQASCDIELSEDWFTLIFHKIVVRTINAMRSKSIPTSDELVAHYLQRNNVYDQEAFFRILEASPFGSEELFNHCLQQVKSSKKRKAVMI